MGSPRLPSRRRLPADPLLRRRRAVRLNGVGSGSGGRALGGRGGGGTYGAGAGAVATSRGAEWRRDRGGRGDGRQTGPPCSEGGVACHALAPQSKATSRCSPRRPTGSSGRNQKQPRVAAPYRIRSRSSSSSSPPPLPPFPPPHAPPHAPALTYDGRISRSPPPPPPTRFSRPAGPAPMVRAMAEP